MENQPLDSMLQKELPNSTGVLVLGILSIVFCFCYGVFGIVFGIIALVMAKKATSLYINTPEVFTEGSYKNMKAGKICAIVGLCLSSFYLIIVLIYISFFAAAIGGRFLQMMQDMQGL